ncbi:hypothetical protein [Dubosiella newyorkensis]|uniref:hypothetical protein n=1 Tax=Dubosiella newyorkensis TaxID=1862672 RepID=UPI0025B589FE|nr:hypothetical protein [Dubosiella newyorkensis]
MAIENEAKQAIGPTISIVVRTGTSVLAALRDFLNAYYLAHLSHGDKVYDNVVNSKRHYGKEFKSAEKFEEYNLLEKNARTGSFAMEKKDRDFIAEECKRMDVNYCLAKKPKNFDKLYDRKFNLGEELTKKEEQILDMFLRREPILDEKGQPVRDQRGIEKMAYKMGRDGKPQKIEGDYILQISESDIPKWEYICRKLEARGRAHQPLKTKLQNLKVAALRRQEKGQEKPKEKTPERSHSKKEKEVSL